jgi:mannose-6-phosphate isomerase-like protein (cupin superfamily)
MRNAVCLLVVTLCAALFLVVAPVQAADPVVPIHWSAEKTREIMRDVATRVNKENGQSPQRFGDSMFLMHREKSSGAEAHTESADFIVINDGAGTILIGGKILNGKLDRPGEIRGDAIEGGTPYQVKAGDTLYVPKAMPHQFQVQPGSHMVYTVVKVTPVP